MSNRNELGLSAIEKKMLTEIHQILTNYEGQTREFGLNLVHSHFEISNDEVMHESNNKSERVLLTRPVKKDLMSPRAYPTSWSVDKSGVPVVQTWCCD